MKKCPFRKTYIRTGYNTYGDKGFPGFDYAEEFQDCMAYYELCGKAYIDGKYYGKHDIISQCKLMSED